MLNHDIGTIVHTDMLSLVFKLFHEHNVEFIRAPYLAGPQVRPSALVNDVHNMYISIKILPYEMISWLTCNILSVISCTL